MSHDKTTSTIGKLLDSTAQRDAVHFAVAPVVAGVPLAPGAHVGLVDGEATDEVTKQYHIGIVDPFLRAPVKPGERFWLFLYPQTVTGMRHEWTHPAFKDEEAKKPVTPSDMVKASEVWLREFCEEEGGLDYEDMIRELQNDDGYVVQHGSQSADGKQLNADFQFHFRNVTGVIPRGYFSCSC